MNVHTSEGEIKIDLLSLRTRNILMRIKSIVLKHAFYENREDSFVRSSNVCLVVVTRSTTFNVLSLRENVLA